jgi:phosphopantothenate-cysteine ligase
MTISVEVKRKIESFFEFHSNAINPIVCITSGGTTVPLGVDSSVFIDNFSVGERGANSAEYFLSQGYSVIYLYRKESKFPFMKNFHSHFGDRINHLLLSKLMFADENASDEEIFRLIWDSCGLNSFQREILELEGKILRNLLKYQYFLPVDFQSVEEYLELLEYLGNGVSLFGPRCCFYLAAAVSDFYIPKDQVFIIVCFVAFF